MKATDFIVDYGNKMAEYVLGQFKANGLILGKTKIITRGDYRNYYNRKISNGLTVSSYIYLSELPADYKSEGHEDDQRVLRDFAGDCMCDYIKSHNYSRGKLKPDAWDAYFQDDQRGITATQAEGFDAKAYIRIEAQEGSGEPRSIYRSHRKTDIE